MMHSMDKPSNMKEVIGMDVPTTCRDMHFKKRGVQRPIRGLPQISWKIIPLIDEPYTMEEAIIVDAH